MKKSRILSLFIALVLCLSFTSCLFGKTYSSALEECTQVLSEYQAEMEEIALKALASSEYGSGNFKDYSYYLSHDQNSVTFSIGAQGMLGGQYWDLVYTKHGYLYNESETFYLEEEDGNNIIRAEKLNEHWWFLWEDYDGTDMSHK